MRIPVGATGCLYKRHDPVCDSGDESVFRTGSEFGNDRDCDTENQPQDGAVRAVDHPSNEDRDRTGNAFEPIHSGNRREQHLIHSQAHRDVEGDASEHRSDDGTQDIGRRKIDGKCRFLRTHDWERDSTDGTVSPVVLSYSNVSSERRKRVVFLSRVHLLGASVRLPNLSLAGLVGHAFWGVILGITYWHVDLDVRDRLEVQS